MNKTVEQAVEETNGNWPSMYKGYLYYFETKDQYLVEPELLQGSDGSMLAICSYEEYREVAAKYKAAQNNPQVAGRQDFYQMISDDMDDFVAKQGKEWVDGLPPVGTKCLAMDRSSKTWIKVSISYSSVFVIVEKCIENNRNNGIEIAKEHPKPEEYRPIKSDRDKAIEQMVRHLEHQYPGGGLPGEIVSEITQSLAEAGYRKQAPFTEAVDKIIDCLGRSNRGSRGLAEQIAMALGFDQ